MPADQETSRVAPKAPADPILALLERLTDVIESLAQDLPADARHALELLTRDIGDARDLGLEPELRTEVLRGIALAQQLLSGDSDSRVRHAGVALSRPSRLLWRRLL